MSILDMLGINHTVFFQLVVFLITITLLSVFVFKPFLSAFEQRELNTKGGDQIADETAEEVQKIKQRYEARAREINEQIKLRFDEERKLAQAESERIINLAKAEAVTYVEQNRQRIAAEFMESKKLIKQEAREVGSAMVSKLLQPGAPKVLK